MNADEKLKTIRNRSIEKLDGILKRPSMYAACDRDLFIIIEDLLETLLFIDGSKIKASSFRNRLQRRGLLASPMGLQGDFVKFYRCSHFFEKVISLYIPFIHQLGYLSIASKLSDKNLNLLIHEYVPHWREKDIHFEELVNLLGAPSYQVGNCFAPVLLFVGSDLETDWVTLHFENPVRENTFGENPPLSSVWLPSKSFVEGLVFTPYGKRYDATLNCKLPRLSSNDS